VRLQPGVDLAQPKAQENSRHPPGQLGKSPSFAAIQDFSAFGHASSSFSWILELTAS